MNSGVTEPVNEQMFSRNLHCSGLRNILKTSFYGLLFQLNFNEYTLSLYNLNDQHV